MEAVFLELAGFLCYRSLLSGKPGSLRGELVAMLETFSSSPCCHFCIDINDASLHCPKLVVTC